jgi:hypothetical protein
MGEPKERNASTLAPPHILRRSSASRIPNPGRLLISPNRDKEI